MKHIGEFFEFAREREAIRVRKEAGEPPPWTDDPILQRNFFCNIYREDDRVTRWFRDNVRGPLMDEPNVVYATIIFRLLNRITVGERIKKALLAPTIRVPSLAAALRPGWKRGEPLVCGAYMVTSPKGLDKLDGMLKVIKDLRPWAAKVVNYCHAHAHPYLEDVHAMLVPAPFLGPFLAYEVVTDLSHTWALRHAPDLDTWASAGPGAERGLSRIWYGHPTGMPSYGSKKGRDYLNERMQEVLHRAFHTVQWGMGGGRPWTMREVEHTCCEYDKWKRVQDGGRAKRRYPGTGDES